MIPLPSVLLKYCVNRLGLFMPLCLFPIYIATVVYKHWSFFGRKLEDLKSKFAEFDKKSMGLEWQTAISPLIYC